MSILKKNVITPKYSGEAMVETRGPAGPAWLTYWRFPLIPHFWHRTGNSQNTWGFSFHWLFFRAWTSDAPHLGFQVELDDQNFQIRLNLPYLWTGLFIPVFPQSWAQKLWRRPKGASR